MNTNSSSRLDYIDVAKGIGILCVILGHSNLITPVTYRYIYSFHMPLFFFITGFLEIHIQNKNYPTFLKKKFVLIIGTYTLFFILSFTLSNLLIIFKQGCLTDMYSFYDVLISYLLSGKYLSLIPLNNFALWYLPTYFITINLFYWLIKYANNVIIFIELIICIVLTFIIQTLLPGAPAFHCNVVPAGLTFMILGYSFRKANPNFNKISKYLIFLLFLGFGISCKYPGNIARITSVWYIVGAIATIVTILCFGYTHTFKTLMWIGQNSLIIYGLHNIIATIIVTFKIDILLNNYLNINLGWELWIIQATLTLCISCILVVFSNFVKTYCLLKYFAFGRLPVRFW